ncbi:MAG: YdbL family protein [Pseudomonadales bacterium]
MTNAASKFVALSGRVGRPVKAVLLAILLLAPLVAQAADLSELKSAGVVGERADGYLGLVQEDAAADATALVQAVNAKRKAQYQRIAASNALALDKVEALAGKKTLSKTAQGHWIFVESWRKK